MEWVAAVASLAIAAVVIWLFNRLISDRNQVAAAWSDVDVQLQRRYDLIPNLVEIVKGYAGHERTVFEQVAAERNASQRAQGANAKGQHETALGQNLSGLIALAEAYPDLKASANFSKLAQQLAEVENSLQSARRFYNGSVRQYNTRLEQFPDLVVARSFAFRAAEFFAADTDARANPKVAL